MSEKLGGAKGTEKEEEFLEMEKVCRYSTVNVYTHILCFSSG
jgi:hypothetical protein